MTGVQTCALPISTTTGGTPDPDGYTVSVSGGGSQPIGNNGSVTFSGLTAGSHTVTLSGIASNCTVQVPVRVRNTSSYVAQWAGEASINGV